MSFKVYKLFLNNLILLLCLSGIFTRQRFPPVGQRLRDEIEDEERNAICCAKKMKCCRATDEEPNIEIRAVMVRCPTNQNERGKPRNIKTLINSNHEENIKKYPGFDDDEPLSESQIKNCNRKLIITMRIDNKGHISKKSQFVIIDHVFDPVTDKSQRLLNPYVIKLRQEHVTQMYGMKFLNYVNSEAREVIYNKHMSNYTGCNTSRNNPTCGIVTYNDKIIPYSEGFCCSCDSLVNIKRQPKSTVHSKEPVVSYTDPAFLMDGVACPSPGKTEEDQEETSKENQAETSKANQEETSKENQEETSKENQEEISTESTANSIKRAKKIHRNKIYDNAMDYDTNYLKNKEIKKKKLKVRKKAPKKHAKKSRRKKKKPFNLDSKEQEISQIEKQHAVQQVLNLDVKLQDKYQDLQTIEQGLFTESKSPATKSPNHAVNNKSIHSKLRSADTDNEDKNLPIAKNIRPKSLHVDENDELTKNINRARGQGQGQPDDDDISKRIADYSKEKYENDFNSNMKINQKNVDENAINEKILKNNEKIIASEEESNVVNYKPEDQEDNKYSRSINDKTHWNFQKQELTQDDIDENLDRPFKIIREKRSVLLKNMDLPNIDVENENIDKRQISSGGSQVRGGQSCANRYTPHGLNPETYHESTHCLRFSEVWYAVYELLEPIVEHSMKIQIFEKHEDGNGQTRWRDITQGKVAHLGSLTPNFEDSSNTVAINYNSKYTKPLESMYAINYKDARILVPEGMDKVNIDKYPEVRGGAKEYLIVHPDLIAVDGDKCNVAGVGFEAFYKQPNRCGVPKGTCLANQPRSLWKHDHKAEKLHRKGCFFLRHYGILPENPIRKNGTDQLYLALQYSGTYSSMIDMEIAADSNAALRPSSTAIITEVYVDSTSLTKTILTIKVTNGGLISSSFFTKLSDCPLDLPVSFNNIESKIVLIAPQHQHVFTLELRGRLTSDIFHCSAEVMNINNELLALRRIKIQKSDRCICTWHCLCACIGSSDGLKCKPMSVEQYHAAGFQGSLPIATSIVANAVLSDVLEMLTFILIFMVLTLLFLGLTKALIGICCCPPMGMWGLGILLDLPKRMNKYYESELQTHAVLYDIEDWPIHPVNKKRVRNISRTLEFCTNVLFFFTYPIVILVLLCQRLCCPYYTLEKNDIVCNIDENRSNPTTTPSSHGSTRPSESDKDTGKASKVSSKLSKTGGTSTAPPSVRKRSRSKPSTRSERSRNTNKTRTTRTTSSKKSSPSNRVSYGTLAKKSKGTSEES